MKYTFISSEKSPFGRACRMLMMQSKIDFDFRVLNFVDSPADAAELAKQSPINKVPILVVDGSQKIFDSRVIANYLIEKHGLRKLTLDEENIVSAIYSCMDVSVILFLMKHSGYDIQAENSYLKRQRERIPANLEYIKNWAISLKADNPSDWNFASMSLYSFLFWSQNRSKTVDLESYPHFRGFLEKFAGSVGVKETSF